MAILKNDWADELEVEFTKPYYLQLRQFLKEEYQTQTIFPDKHDIFNALHYTSLENTKVVILGQDPYHGVGQAHGLSFSVQSGITAPPSLQNIFKELHDDLGYPIPNHGHLLHWAKQGVLLLNTVLTVRAHEAHSHKTKGWEEFTDRVIQVVNKKETPVVFILWGSHAQKKAVLITNKQHLFIRSPHPSPLSSYRGFFGSKPFSRTNQYLKEVGLAEIDWQLPTI
ncbi:uracil-DNA glycosylase [Paenibacillus yanchengensis]|uniref:Uracil-DNA glycosylase n=1 Tax=Paenibacillus yanchengensis TaxID=2035833 RepID=A0ABW4YQM4_9BACL